MGIIRADLISTVKNRPQANPQPVMQG